MEQINKIEELFFENPSKEFYLREISRLKKVPLTTTKRILNQLRNDQIINRLVNKPYSRYIANTENFYYKYYKKNNMIEKIYRSGLINYLIKEINPTTIFLFGSCAKGEYDAKSDIDLFVESEEEKVILNKYEKILRHKINLFFDKSISNLNKELFNNIINGEKLYGFMKLKLK